MPRPLIRQRLSALEGDRWPFAFRYPLTASVPTDIPTALAAGDTWRWDKWLGDYSAADGWVLTYALRGVGAIDITATTNATDSNAYSVTVTASSTAGYAAGNYSYIARVTLAGAVYTVDSGVVLVTPNLGTATAGQLQTHAEKMVALCEAAIEAQAAAATAGGSGTIQSYTIGTRSVTFRDAEDLKRQLIDYKWQVWRERNPGRIGPKRSVKFVG